MTSYSDMSDKQLMQLVCAGNHDAFSQMVRTHTARYYALAFRTLHNAGDADDAVQLAFIKLWQKPYAWEANKSQFTTWFYRVVLNNCHDLRRKNRRTINVDDQVFETLQEPAPDEEQLYQERQKVDWQTRCLEVCLASLPTSQRDALNLVVYSELPQKQAAEIMGVSLKALESLLFRAKKSLKSGMAELQKQQQLACCKVADVCNDVSFNSMDNLNR